VYLSKRKSGTSKLLYNHIIDSIYCDQPKRFTELQDVIFQQNEYLDASKIDYLRKLFLIKEKWATAHLPNIFTGGMNTMTKSESMNYFIKKAMTERFTLVDLFIEILKIEFNVIKSSRHEIANSNPE